MKVLVEKARCMGNARCAAVAPELFNLDDDGYIAHEEVDVPAGQEGAAQIAVKSCPEQILQVREDL